MTESSPAPATLPGRITIVGLGLMGGSLALALRKAGVHLTGVDRNQLVCEAALGRGIVDTATTDLASGVDGADLVVLATPVRVILRLLAELPAHRPAGCLVLDLGSTKDAICQAMGRLPPAFQAIGGHPMCGRETAGLAYADAGLYQDQTFVLCSTGRTTPDAIGVARHLVQTVGARPLALEAERHDRYVALTSHLPYLLASALIQRAAREAESDPRLWLVSASGFRDTGRLAGSDTRMMLDILLTNREAILAQLAAYREGLATLAALVAEGDEVRLRHWLNQRQHEHQVYRHKKTLDDS